MKAEISAHLAGRARSLVRSQRLKTELRMRQAPAMKVNPASGHPSVYYLSPDEEKPSGGVRLLYRHVDLLNEDGIRAAVVHKKNEFRCTWFKNETPIVSAPRMKLCADDILVVPDIYAPGFGRLPRGVRTLVFNQGAHHTFDFIGLESTVGGAPYNEIDDLVGIMTVSADSEDILRFAFPDTQVFRCRPVVDANLFHLSSKPSGRSMAYVTSRRPEERNHLLHMLRAHGVDWDLVPINGKSEIEVAEVLRSCALFLSFSERDGFGLPPAEAMASGCYVVGYTGSGGREFFDPGYCAPVSDLVEFANAVARIVARPLPELTALGRKASAHILGTYTSEGLRDDLQRVYEPLLK